MDLNEFKEKLKRYNYQDIIVTDHAILQASVRGVDLSEVKKNILNPIRLVYVRKQDAKKPNEEKYDCYFAYSKIYIIDTS